MSYAALTEHYQRIAHLRHAEAILSWDEATVMPAGGGAARGQALSTLRGVIHQHATSAQLADLFAAAADESRNLSPWQQANLREMTREWVRATALPQNLVEAMSRAESACEQGWRKLRPANDFAGFLPLFGEVVRLKREAARALGDKLALDPYDALLDGFEPGMRASLVAPLFSRLREILPGLIARAVERQAREQVATCEGPFPVERQRALGIALMRRVGFDFDHGRLDTSHHPFCGGVPEDVRITTRYDVHNYASALFGVLHESGHAKYEQNLPRAWRGQPVGAARGMSVHESQSLLLEMQVGRSGAFLEFVSPIIAAAFPELGTSSAPLETFSQQNLFLQVTRVKPSLIRVEADEVTYPCHVALRFELEQGLIEGSLRPEDVPEAWDAGMRRLLGLSTSGNDRDGCMQDVHWPAGLFGYFPSYTLGALTAAQLFRAARRAQPDLMDRLRRGELDALDAWLRDNVWSRGSYFSTSELIERATGSPLGTEAFEEHIERVYVDRSVSGSGRA
ncbi:MAG TPA: carboxypeptidase M32 [Polyangia bacterium]